MTLIFFEFYESVVCVRIIISHAIINICLRGHSFNYFFCEQYFYIPGRNNLGILFSRTALVPVREINFLKNPEAVREKNLFEKCFGKQNISKLIKTVGSECRSRWKYYEMKTRKKKEERGEENLSLIHI